MEMGEYAKLPANETTNGRAQREPPHPGQNTSRGSKTYILVAVSFGLLFMVQSALNVSLWLQAAECSSQSNNASTNNFTKMSAGDIEALILEKDRLVQEKDQLVQEKDQLVQEKDQLVQEKDLLVQDKTQLVQEKDLLVQEKDQLVQDKTQLVEEKDQLVQDKTQLVQEKDQLVQDKKQLVQEKDQLVRDKTQLVQEKDQLVQEKDLLVQDKTQLVQEKDLLVQEKDLLVQDKTQLVEEKDQLVQDKTQLVQEKDLLVQDKKQLVQEKDLLVKENKEQTANNTNLVNDNTRLGQMVTELQNQIQPEQNIPDCPSGWQSHESTCYQLSSRENTWQHAKEDCKSKRSHLVLLNDEAEEKVVRGFGGDAKLWMGLSGNLNRQKTHWYFTTVDSSPLFHRNWNAPTPNVARNISCAYVDYHTSYLKTWFLVSCEEQHKWMCEMKPASICQQNIPCCPSGWQSHESTCYQLSSRENTWQHAKEDCESKGSHLVLLNDEAEEKVVRGFGGNDTLWMGLRADLNRQKNQWELTVDSSRRCYGNWKNPTPEVASNIYCVYVDYHTSSLKNWFRVSCEEQHKWMCEKKRASIFRI
ncbi:hypothetical protein OYC64_000996 [Pagothenia borchgrevinki]|uniref:C-type lectin domain-containing protein n=1 Tax=Pagothenia borchgrevinki TaxID=8213 RepID=A0ABD2HIM8_PAGBO